MRKKVTEQSIKQKIKKGFGQEIMSKYKPWLSVRDFGSLGVSS